MTVDEFREIRQKAGGLVILLPRNVSNMNTEEKEVSILIKPYVLVSVNPTLGNQKFWRGKLINTGAKYLKTVY